MCEVIMAEDGDISTAGDCGIAAAGDYGAATAGNGGTAMAGYRGTVMAGRNGIIALHWWDSGAERCRLAVAYVGDDGILPDVPYRLDDDHQFVPAR